MAKNISSVKDLVIQTITNGSEIETKAKNNDAEACFQMGMIHLLGASSSIDFKKATTYFGNQSLAGNPDANRLLGFITECEGDYSEAFKCYTKAKDTTGKDKNLPLYNKVFEERNHLQKFFKEMGLPSTALNTEVSAILGDYVKGGKSKVEASLKIATICNDESSCLEAAQTLYDKKDFYSAKKWLQKGNIASDNSLYAAINDKLAKSKKGISLPNTLEVVDIQGTSLFPENYASNGIADVKHRCDAVAQSSKKLWLEEITGLISQIKNQLKEEEEEQIRKQKEEERRIRKQKEEEEKRLKKQKEEEEKRKKQAEYQAYLREQEEEEERKRKRKKIIKYVLIFVAVFGVIIFASVGGNSQDETSNSSETVMVDNTEETQSDLEETSSNVKAEKAVPASKVETAKEDSGYDSILSDRKLSDSDLNGKTKKELEIMRNSIYARYGYKFKREDLLNYFSQFSWYNPTTNDMSAIYNLMSDIEKYNIEFIKKYE